MDCPVAKDHSCYNPLLNSFFQRSSSNWTKNQVQTTQFFKNQIQINKWWSIYEKQIGFSYLRTLWFYWQVLFVCYTAAPQCLSRPSTLYTRRTLYCSGQKTIKCRFDKLYLCTLKPSIFLTDKMAQKTIVGFQKNFRLFYFLRYIWFMIQRYHYQIPFMFWT